MEQNRVRGHSFYEDLDTGFVTPNFSSSINDGSDHLSLENHLLSNDEDIEYQLEETLEPTRRGRSVSTSSDDDEELLKNVGRSRSSSRTRLPALQDPSGLVIPDLSQINNLDNNNGNNKDNNGRSSRSNSLDKSGPLTPHEVQILRKGLEDAEITRNSDQLREEEEEKQAAKEEEEERLALAGLMGAKEDEKVTQAKKGSIGMLLSSSASTSTTIPEKSVTPPLATTFGKNTNAENTNSTGPSVQQKYTMGSDNHNMRRFKILLLGDSGVGKTSLTFRWTEDRYLASLVGTVGVNFKGKKVNIEGETIQVQVWDTAGQSQFHKITTSYYKGAHAIMVVYDVSDKETFDNVEYWIRNIKENASDNVHVALVGNKTDLRHVKNSNYDNGDGREDGNSGGTSEEDNGSGSSKKEQYVSTDLALEVSERLGVPYYETSAKDATGCDEAFMDLVMVVLGKEKSMDDYGNAVRSASRDSSKKSDKKGFFSSMFSGRGKTDDKQANVASAPQQSTVQRLDTNSATTTSGWKSSNNMFTPTNTGKGDKGNKTDKSGKGDRGSSKKDKKDRNCIVM